ncbi:MAG: hydrogenase iron-sulfur subunit [Planctomycetes bacterium]|nr:hydrogenase iron-sulfur subunit [Planctomycetota bacterium]
MKTGVLLCDCGGEVSGRLDADRLVREAEANPLVAWAQRVPYACGPGGREVLLQRRSGKVPFDRVVLAGCSPRIIGKRFREACAGAGLVEIVNVRDLCARAHPGGADAASEMASGMIRMGLARSARLSPLEPVRARMTQAAAVIGGGLAGMTAALALASRGLAVKLVERGAELGGSARASADADGLAGKLAARVRASGNIEVFTRAVPSCVAGSYGNLEITLLSPGDGNRIATLRVGGVVLATEGDAREMAKVFRLPLDAEGFIPDLQPDLKPEQYAPPAVVVVGHAHGSCTAGEAVAQATLRAASLAALLARQQVEAPASHARVDAARCRGCAACRAACPFDIPVMEPREGGVSVSRIDPFLCKGCGGCVAHCPTGAATIPGLEDRTYAEEIGSALAGGAWGPAKVVAFLCSWSGFAAAELAGVRRMALPPGVVPVRIPCAARLSAGLVLEAFSRGADGVVACVCADGECHYLRGNADWAAASASTARLLGLLGIDAARFGTLPVQATDSLGFRDRLLRFVSRVEGLGAPKAVSHGA